MSDTNNSEMEKMDKLKQIGFYTLEDERARNCSITSPLWRCELLLTSRCNFNCPYCRKRTTPDLTLEEAKNIVNLWIKDNLQNIRFSGGEPTLWPHLPELVSYCQGKIKRIALSTNGSANREYYQKLIDIGINDFSISLDACCSAMGNTMSGTQKQWSKVVKNIKFVSSQVYTTVGVVLTDTNLDQLEDIITFAHNLGVADIRIIPAAQQGTHFSRLEFNTYNHPILSYRINRSKQNKPTRGINKGDCHKCSLVLDDMAVEGNHHYPCIIYLREKGKPIGEVGLNMREERFNWLQKHNSFEDPICKKNCLDVCVDYNNRVLELHSC